MNNTTKDLTKEAPRSPHEKIGGFVIIARTIDKCRATIASMNGEYHFDCPLDNQLFSFMDIKGADFMAYTKEGHTDEEIAAWVKKEGIERSDKEIEDWNKTVSSNNYSAMPEKKSWLEGENKRVGLDKDATLFDFLDADDRMSFKK